jgi:hypothetical protein
LLLNIQGNLTVHANDKPAQIQLQTLLSAICSPIRHFALQFHLFCQESGKNLNKGGRLTNDPTRDIHENQLRLYQTAKKKMHHCLNKSFDITQQQSLTGADDDN